jgi:Oxidoreductase family, NAD-binding Rossmann fold
LDPKQIKRRDFLRGSAASLAGAATVTHLVSATGCQSTGSPPVETVVMAEETHTPAPTPAKVSKHDKVIVGSIGTGDLGRRHHLSGMLLPNPRVQMAAVCDVDANHRNEAARMCLDRAKIRVGVYEDFRRLLDRKDIDAVLIAVPDHWHALIAIAACEAGKDVYCEKPLTYSIEEGKALLAAARRYGTVFQTGSQQRSDA